MNVRTTILMLAAAMLASPAGAQGGSGDAQQPPSDSKSQPWYQKDAQKARELGQKGESAAKQGASSAGKKVNEGGQALNEKVVGTKTVTGKVADVSKDQVTLKRSDGTPLDLRITGSTKVTIGGHKQPVGALQQGDEVRASYAQSGGSATATKIEVTRAPPSTAPDAGSRSPSDKTSR